MKGFLKSPWTIWKKKVSSYPRILTRTGYRSSQIYQRERIKNIYVGAELLNENAPDFNPGQKPILSRHSLRIQYHIIKIINDFFNINLFFLKNLNPFTFTFESIIMIMIAPRSTKSGRTTETTLEGEIESIRFSKMLNTSYYIFTSVLSQAFSHNINNFCEVRCV